MTTTVTEPAPPPAVSLNKQIRDAEQQLLLRRHASAVHAAALERRLRKTLSSPLTLAAAVGVGFAAGHFNWRRQPRPGDAASRKVRVPFLARVMNALTLGGSLLAMLRAIDTAEGTDRKNPAATRRAGH